MKAILFDFDGVVIKSMEQHFEAWRKAFEEQEITLKPEDFFVLEGQGIHTIANHLGAQNGLSAEQISKVMDRKLNYYNQFMTIRFYEYFPEMLQNLRMKNIPMGIVTGGTKSRVTSVIENHFAGVFKSVVTVDDVERGKPFPDSFLKGAAELGLPPADCVVVENAPLGVEGAKTAGTKVIAITTTLPAESLSKADYIVNNFQELELKLSELLDQN